MHRLAERPAERAGESASGAPGPSGFTCPQAVEASSRVCSAAVLHFTYAEPAALAPAATQAEIP